MRTDALIEALAADGAKPRRFLRVFSVALAVAAAAGAGVFLMMLKPRANFLAVASSSMRYDLKLLVGLILAVTAAFALSRIARPGASRRGANLALLLAPAALAIGVLAEMAVVPQSEWVARLVGTNAGFCMVHIPLISLAPLGVILFAMRSGAADSPTRAGALAGLAAGGLAASLYAVFCNQDSPLFVAVWYVAGVLATAAIGAAMGSRLLRW
ncbi:NrsF family protein [Hansschlegelia quercus]|uniref:DUF1109 family protein n=1 Tax=Hansschlegelia quercus TaxID=2528245 RepID=A0A4Q9GSE8_9HYPH|nr:NrsF family protein [Hansschlegelia quercus]TBN55100.1 DUF1109 family protein [Hansschlegelia quercus]